MSFHKSVKLVELFLLSLLVGQLVQADDDHRFSCKPLDDGQRDPWIGNLEELKQLFHAKIEIVDLTTRSVGLLEETYDFLVKTGEYKFEHRLQNGETRIDYAKYGIGDAVYKYSNSTNKCSKHLAGDTETPELISQWLPKDVIADSSEHYKKILGPSAMLLHMWSKFDSTTRYSFTDENQISINGINLCIQDKYMLRFSQIYENSLHKNLIKTIEVLQKKDQEWELKVSFNYYHVEIPKDNQTHLNDNLPLGLACARLDPKFKPPQIHSQQSEIDFQFIQNQGINYPNQKNINHFDPTYSIVEHHKLFFDKAHGLGVNFGQSPLSKETIKSVHDFATQTVFEIDLQSGHCTDKLEEESGDQTTVDFSDPMSIIRNIPPVLALTDKNSFVGRFETRNIDCMVYETLFWLNVAGENQSFIVTHYYAAYNFDLESTEKLPVRIDLRRFQNDQLDVQLGYFVFLINKFYPALDFGRQEIFDISNCMPNYYQYNWFLVEITCAPEEIEKLKNAPLALIEEFRKQLSISSLRIPKILVDFDDSTIFFTTKLLEVPAIKNHFDYKFERKLTEPQLSYATDHEENCAQSCFSKSDCVAYSFCSDMLCSQLMLDGYGSDEKMGIPDGYVKSAKDHNCALQTRKYKLKRDDLSSRDIRSVMSELQRKVQTGEFKMNIKLPNRNQEDQIDLTASTITLHVEPGSKQSSYSDEELELNRGTSKNYDQYFSVYQADFSFDFKKIRSKTIELADQHSNVALADCELQCLNNGNCNSFSYCPNRICVITSLKDEQINSNLKSGIGCSTSKKNYLAKFAVHKNRGIRNVAKEKRVLASVGEQNPETCAKICDTSEDYECLSFEYCDAQIKNSVQGEKACLFHELNLQSEHKLPLEWDFFRSHCDHYTKKHSTDYKEYSMQELIETDLVEHTKMPLEKCATLCDEHELCNTFDYCFENDNVADIRCRLHSDVYNVKNANTTSPYCSIYEAIKAKIPVKKVILQQTTYSKGLTVLLSFVALISGSSIGVLLSFLVIRKFFRDPEDDD